MTDTYLLGGHMMLADGAFELADLRIRDGRVAQIGVDLPPSPGADVVEVTGFTTPGLIDAHTHVAWAGTAPMPATLEGVRARVDENLRRMLRSGVTTIRDVGSIDGVALEASGGPTRWCANQIVCAVGGHGTETADQWAALAPQAIEARGAAEFRAAVRTQVERGAQLVKITLNAAELQVTHAEARAAVDEAHRLGRRVACHASIPEAIDLAIDVGVDTIEHGNGATPEQLARMTSGGIVLVPTVWIYQRSLALARAAAAASDANGSGSNAAWPPPVEIWQARVDAHRAVVRDALASGTTIAAGTDAIEGCPPDSLADEMLALHRLGLDPLETLRAATAGGAAALGAPELGVLAEGGRADLVVFDAMPQEVVTGRAAPVAVFQAGRRVR